MARSTNCYLTDRLPPEIRKEIFGYVLTKPNPIEFTVTYPVNRNGSREQRYVVAGHQRNASHIGQIFDTTTREWVPEPARATALLMVCKLVHTEAEEVLYGSNIFKFLNTARLANFLTSFGGPAYAIKQVELHHYVVGSAKAFWRSLLPLVNLRRLAIGHSGLCRNGAGAPGPRSELLVKHMTPLLKILKASYEVRRLASNPADVLVIRTQRCLACSCKCGKEDRKAYCDCLFDKVVSAPSQQALFATHRAALRDAVTKMRP
nr:hypothetical protein B0A51_12246 [Rachicladosporium sp. CCFEE 5018]